MFLACYHCYRLVEHECVSCNELREDNHTNTKQSLEKNITLILNPTRKKLKHLRMCSDVLSHKDT